MSPFQAVRIKPGSFLPNIHRISTSYGFGGWEDKRVKFSGRGTVDFPLPEKPADPIWVKLAESPHPIIPYETHELC